MDRQPYTAPAPLARSVRPDNWRGLTSGRAGVVIPLAYFPLLREDAIRGQFMAQVKMAEAVRTIINPIRIKMQAHLVSKYCLDRFNGSMETLNRSYMDEMMPNGDASPPWFVKETGFTGDTGHQIADKLGLHYDSVKAPLNTELTESYNQVINHRRKQVSKALPLRPLNGTDLARAMWPSNKLSYIKPSFDAALMEGAVPLQGMSMVEGIGTQLAVTYTAGGMLETGGKTTTSGVMNIGGTNMRIKEDEAFPGFPGVYANLSRGTGSFSLAQMRMAQDAVILAKMRDRYEGIPDEYLIDLLMRGIRVPPEDLKMPELIAEAEAVIGQTERYATDGASLDQSVTMGVASLSFNLNTPPINVGGMVLVTMEIVPEQLTERQSDWGVHWYADKAKWLPDAERDGPDPQKVETVANGDIDVLHSDPEGLFGYEPLNYGWRRNISRVGGRYKRPVPDAFVEDRQRIWAVEKTDPTLSTDFYLCPSPFPHTPFADQAADPFEIITMSKCDIVGLTVFGGGFEEDDDHYEKIIAKIDMEQLKGDGTDTFTPISQDAPVVEQQPATEVEK